MRNFFSVEEMRAFYLASNHQPALTGSLSTDKVFCAGGYGADSQLKLPSRPPQSRPSALSHNKGLLGDKENFLPGCSLSFSPLCPTHFLSLFYFSLSPDLGQLVKFLLLPLNQAVSRFNAVKLNAGSSSTAGLSPSPLVPNPSHKSSNWPC
eukprot:GFUD01015679.1.p1 GENE.GFUD01015679.1~~GFUD01015679.1.p1  ORF type:complete len:151 (-),score=23.93 GFUD01015679.1:42-494(-)